MIDDVIFPLVLNEVSSAPEFNTTITLMGNGAEQRIGNWQEARIVANASLGVRSLKDLKTLIAFFRARKGPLRGFLYKDMVDFKAAGDQFGTGDGTTTAFQLKRIYSDTANTDSRKIYRPKTGTIQIYKDAVLQTVTTHYTINYTTGIVTFVTAPAAAAVLTWNGEFYIPMRFADDRLPADEIFFDLFTDSDSDGIKGAGEFPVIPMIEIRGDET